MSVTWGVAVRSLNDVLRTTLLTKRRAVDHCRTASCLCRMPWPGGARAARDEPMRWLTCSSTRRPTSRVPSKIRSHRPARIESGASQHVSARAAVRSPPAGPAARDGGGPGLP